MMRIAEMHANSSGLKAFCTWWGADALETCRRACGGHAFSAYLPFYAQFILFDIFYVIRYSFIPDIIGDFGVYTTGGGDNIVIAQQLSRFLLGSLKNAMKGKAIPESFAYLKDGPEDLSGEIGTLPPLAFLPLY